MLFNSISYLLFFPLVCLVYWLAPGWLKKPVLLLASYVFYMSWIPVYGVLIFVLTLVNYGLGLAIAKFRGSARLLIIVGLIGNLGVLCFYKYSNFIIKSAVDLMGWAWPSGVPAYSGVDQVLVDVILPLGISFFVFEFIHYLVDVHKGDQAIVNPIDFALFAAFFPSQIAGPIKRYQDFIRQLGRGATFDPQSFHQGITLLIQGLFKKVALSDNLAVLVNAGFGLPANLGTVDAWLASCAFALQIYFDFSGYTDMGRGSAMMLGFVLPDNFNLPYMASSVSDFWRRWHISLSSWLRDYLYIPLGGGRVSPARKNCNLMITMLLGGLWHGAAWHFVVWGGVHGAALVVNHQWEVLVKQSKALQSFHAKLIGKLMSVVLTFVVVLIGWVFFRADTVGQALQLIGLMLVQMRPSSVVIDLLKSSPVVAALSAYSVYGLIVAIRSRGSSKMLFALQLMVNKGLLARPALYLGGVIAALGFAPPQPSPFIYFQF